jgi:hypothetical protein
MLDQFEIACHPANSTDPAINASTIHNVMRP